MIGMTETAQLSKDDASDLQSLIQQAEESALELQRVTNLKALADRQLAARLWAHTTH